jgi:DNA-binding response OmpR family regulator
MSDGARILIIDDDLFVLKVAGLFLTKSGFTVNSAPDWRAGMEMWMDWRPDLVLLDLMMPGKSGWEILAEMRAKQGYAEVPVLIFTANEHPDTCTEALERGAQGTIPKPFDQASLIQSIEQALSASAR